MDIDAKLLLVVHHCRIFCFCKWINCINLLIFLYLQYEAKVDSQLQTYDKYSRFILRDMTGKYCWDHSVLYSDYTSEDETGITR